MVNHPNRSKKEIRPREHLRAASVLYPQAWNQLSFLRSVRGKDISDWPEWCYCPLAGAYAIVSEGGPNRLGYDKIGDVARIGALGAWRMGQTIYRFDPVLYKNLTETEIKKIPVEVLYRLPQWCVYVETPGLFYAGYPLCGFFAHLEHDINMFRSELRLLLDVDRNGTPALIALPLHMSNITVDLMLDATIAEANRHVPGFYMPSNAKSVIVDDVAPLISLIVYLCCDNPDYGDKKPPTNPAPKKTKRGWKLFAASSADVRVVGHTIGGNLRSAGLFSAAADDRQGPSPHIRSAHWHSYWTGPRSGEQKLVVKWIPPTLVGVGDPGVAIKKVR